MFTSSRVVTLLYGVSNSGSVRGGLLYTYSVFIVKAIFRTLMCNTLVVILSSGERVLEGMILPRPRTPEGPCALLHDELNKELEIPARIFICADKDTFLFFLDRTIFHTTPPLKWSLMPRVHFWDQFGWIFLLLTLFIHFSFDWV